MTRMLEIEISEELLQTLNERAQQLKVSPSQLAAIKLRESLAPESNQATVSDEEFAALAHRIIEEDIELLRRLA